MAIKNNETAYSSASRRWFFGTNVLVLILLVTAVVIMVNYLGHWKNLRHDVSGGFAGVRLSERAAKVLAGAGKDLRITTVYTSDEPESDRKKYFPKVQDLCQEVAQANRNIKVQHLYGGNERAELRDRVQSKFGSAAEKYDEVIKLSTETWNELGNTVAPVQKEIETLLQSDAYLSSFSTLANIAAQLRKDLENIEQTRKEVEELVHGEGLPRYQEANSKIRTANDDLKKHLEEAQKWMQDTHKLIKVLADPKADFVVKTRAKLAEISGLVAELKKTAGDPKDPNVPDDPRPLLQEFAKAANRLSAWLNEEAVRADQFVREYPGIQRHPRWLIRVQMGPFPAEMQLHGLIADTSDALSQNTQALRDILSKQVPKDQLQNVVRQVRNLTQQVAVQLLSWQSGFAALLEEAAKLEPSGQDMQFLVRGSAGDMFKPVTDKLNDIGTKMTGLPVLKIDEIANRLQQDNIIVVENEKEVRVVSFDEVWPVADPEAGRFGLVADEKIQRRVFTGDAALTGAVLSMQSSSKPIATVIFVVYENDAPPQMRQMGRGGRNVGPISLDQINTLKEKLEQANFKVKEWNLGAEGDAAKRPEPEEGTQPVYVLCPPAPRQMPNYMLGTTSEKGFGDAEMKQVSDQLAKEGKAVVLGLYVPSGPMMPPFENPYDKYLVDNWGIKMEPDYRVIRGVIDKHQPGHYSVNVTQWMHMQLNYFNKEHPVGEPLRTRRVLMTGVCPVRQADKVPEHVKLSKILEVPASANEFWAEKNVLKIIQTLRSPDGGSFPRSEESFAPPFPVMMAGENEQTKSKVVVLGSSLSLRDDYLSQRVMRIEGKQTRLVTDPPPSENADLFINAVYWLCGRPDLIGAGPAEVPVVPPIEERNQKGLFLATGGWALAIGIVGLVMMFVRRK